MGGWVGRWYKPTSVQLNNFNIQFDHNLLETRDQWKKDNNKMALTHVKQQKLVLDIIVSVVFSCLVIIN